MKKRFPKGLIVTATVTITAEAKATATVKVKATATANLLFPSVESDIYHV